MDTADHLRTFLTKNIFSPVSGFTFSDWFTLLRQAHFRIAPRYIPRALLITLNSLATTAVSRREQRTYGEVLSRTKIPPPIFILGHWRSGTTHLHNLLSIDTQFAYPNFFQTTQPHSFLITEERASKSRALKAMAPKTRLIDNMKASLDAPMEDEVALSILCGLSPILSSVFPRRTAHFDRYLTFRDVSEMEIEAWKQAFTGFVRKLSLKHDRPLILKSPPHTCRIRLILELFPDARFIHIHRNPYAVFLSYKRSTQLMNKLIQLQLPDLEHLDERIINQYRLMYDAYFEEVGMIPAGRFHELAYETLEQDPMGELQAIYSALGIEGFSTVEQLLNDYLGTLRGYRKSELPEIEPALQQQIATAWAQSFNTWGYPQ